MTDILDDARFQFESADKKLEGLDTLIEAFLKEDPYSFVINRNLATGEYVFKAKVRKMPGREIPKVIADVLQDVRTGLDYIAFAFAEKMFGTAPSGTEFPIFLDVGRFRASAANGPKPGSGLYKIRGIAPAIQASIEGLQPFNERPTTRRDIPFGCFTN